MKPKIKIIYSNYYPSIKKNMVEAVIRQLPVKDYDLIFFGVPGSFEIPYEIARSIKEDIFDNENKIASFKGKDKEKIRNNIILMAKLSQLNLDKQCIYSAYLALGCIIKGKTINHEAISVSIFTNLQRLSIENTIPIGNGIFNANNIKEAEEKAIKCAIQASNVLKSFINDKKK